MKLEETRSLLNELCVPIKQQTDMCCYVLLAMANIRENDTWSAVSNK